MVEKIRRIFNSRFGKDIAVTIVGQVIIIMFAFGLNKLLSIKLGTIGYGEYSIAKRTAGVITFVMLSGLGIAIPKYIAIYHQQQNKLKEARCIISALIIISALSLIIICILFLFRENSARILFGENGYMEYMLPILLYSFSCALASFAYSFYCGLGKFYMYSMSQIYVQISTFVIALIFNKSVITLMYVWSIVIGGYGIFISVRIWANYYSIAKIKSFTRDLKPSILELVTFCFPRVPGEFFLFAYTVTPLIIINQKVGIETSAYFAAATSINSMVTPLFSFVGVVLLPVVSKSIVSNKFAEADRKVKALGKIYLIVGVLGIIFVEVFTPFVVNILFSSDYQICVPIIRIMIIAVLPNVFYLLLRNPLDAMSKIPYNTINLMISFIILNLLVELSSSTTAYALSFVVAYGILGILSIWAWRRCKKEISKKVQTNLI